MSDAVIKTETSTLTKAELAEEIFIRIRLSKNESLTLVDQFFDVMRETLAQGEDIKISGFGNFTIRDKVSRPGRNPKTGESTQIDARRVVAFTASQKLKDQLQKQGSNE